MNKHDPLATTEDELAGDLPSSAGYVPCAGSEPQDRPAHHLPATPPPQWLHRTGVGRRDLSGVPSRPTGSDLIGAAFGCIVMLGVIAWFGYALFRAGMAVLLHH